MSSSSKKDEENKDETNSIQSFFDLALASKTQKDLLSCSTFFENYSLSSCKKLAYFAIDQINTHNLLSIDELNQNQHELSVVLNLLSICTLTSQRISSMFFNPNENSSLLFLQILTLLSKVSMETEESTSLLNSLLIFLASSIWDSKIIAKFALTKLSNIKRENNQTILIFLTSLTQMKSENPIKGISSFILLELLQFLSNTKVASANTLKNNVDRYSKWLTSTNDPSLFSKFIRESFKKIKSHISHLNSSQSVKASQEQNQNVKSVQDQSQNSNANQNQNQTQVDQSNIPKEPSRVELLKLQKQLDKANSDYSALKTNLQKQLDQFKTEYSEKFPSESQNKDVNSNNIQVYQYILSQAQKMFQFIEKAIDELSKNKISADSILKSQLEVLKRENQELKNKLSYDEESEYMRRQIASNKIENEKLTKRLEYMKQLNNEIKLNSEIDQLRTELKASNIQLNDLQEENAKLKHENQSLSLKENEFINYRNKLLDAKIELISLRKENKRLEAEKKKLEENQIEKNTDQQLNQKNSKNPENSEPSQNLSDKKLLEAKLQIESLKQQISEKDMLNARLKATQLSMTNSTQAEIADLKNQLNEATKQINLLKSIKIELSVQVDTLKQKLSDIFTSNKKLANKNSEAKSASFSGTLPNNSFINSDEYDEAPKLRSQIFSLSNELEKLKKANQPSLELDDARKEILSLRNQISELKNISQTGNFRNKNRDESKPPSEKNSDTSYEEQNKLLQDQLAEKDSQISDLLAQVQDLQSNQIKNQISNSIIKETTINDLKRKIGENEKEMASLRSQLTEKETEISSLKNKLTINDNGNNSEGNKSEIEKKLLEKEKIISNLQEQLNSIQSKNDSNSNNNSDGLKLQDEIAKLTSQISEKDSQIKKIEKENKLLKSQLDDMKSSSTERNIQNEKSEADSDSPRNNSKDPQITKLVKEIAKLRKSKSKLQQQVDQLTQSESLKDSQITTLRGQITIFQQFKVTEAKKDSELIRLQSQLDEYEANEEKREAQIQQKLNEKENEINSLKSEIEKLKNGQPNSDSNENKKEEANCSNESPNNENKNDENDDKNKTDNKEKTENKEQSNEKSSNNENQNNDKTANNDNKNIENDKKSKNENKSQDDGVIQKLLSEKEKIIDSYESKISGYQTQITELQNKIHDYDIGKKITYDTQLKLLEIDKLNDEIFLKDTEISSLKNSLSRQQKQIEDLEKVQYLYTNNRNGSDFYPSSSNDNDIQLYQKDQEIAQLKLQISNQKDRINELTMEIKANNMNSYYDYNDYDNKNKVSNAEYFSLKQKCERLERELNQKNIDEQIESQNMQRLKNELSSYQVKFNHLKESPQSDGILYQTLKEEYSQLESKHQVALKLIGKLWARNQTLIQENGGKPYNCMNDNDDDFTPDDFQFL